MNKLNNLRNLSRFARQQMSARQLKYRQMCVEYFDNNDLVMAAEIAKDLERGGQRSALGDEILALAYDIECNETEDQVYAYS